MTREDDNYKISKQENKCGQRQRTFKQTDPQRSQTRKDTDLLQSKRKLDREHTDQSF